MMQKQQIEEVARKSVNDPKPKGSKYMPHQGNREQRRRAAAIEKKKRKVA